MLKIIYTIEEHKDISGLAETERMMKIMRPEFDQIDERLRENMRYLECLQDTMPHTKRMEEIRGDLLSLLDFLGSMSNCKGVKVNG